MMNNIIKGLNSTRFQESLIEGLDKDGLLSPAPLHIHIGVNIPIQSTSAFGPLRWEDCTVPDFEPQYHEEYRAVYPDEDEHYQFFKSQHADTSWIRMNEERIDRGSHRVREAEEGYQSQRWGEANNPDLVEFLKNKPSPGAIYAPATQTPPHRTFPPNRPSFASRVIRPYHLEHDRTTLAIGIPDISFLLRANPLTTSDTQARVVFINRCSFAVAKTKVIVTMLELGYHPKSVIQIWISTTWDWDAFESFRETLQYISSQQGFDPEHDWVDRAIEFWKTTPDMTADTARREWFKRARFEYHNKVIGPDEVVANLRRVEDRVAVMRYGMTGEFMGRGVPVFGNVTMFAQMEGRECISFRESVLHMLPMEDVLKEASDENVVRVAWKWLLDTVKRISG
ncbi:hypothetical protein HK097_005515, partial [Rhizophlyctis rosea]